MAELVGKTKAVFLDRDGVINEEVDQLSRIQDFKLYAFAATAIKKIHNAGYLVIVVTNQPMIAKGFILEKDVIEIHRRMQATLQREGAVINAIYYCPHHPEKGFVGEVPELKIVCNCRKPGIGMIQKAVEDFNIDLKKSFFIGDSSTDAKTAENAGIAFIGVKTGYGLTDGQYQISKKIPLCENILQAVDFLLNV